MLFQPVASSRKIPPEARGLITGGASGLGRALACRLAERGAHLALVDLDGGRLDAVRAEVEQRGGTAYGITADVSSWDDWQRVVQTVDDKLGRVDVLILNAGVASAGEVGEVPLEDWEWLLRINLWGVLYGCHIYAPRMRAAKNGWILNVASAAAIASAPSMGPYNVAKAGVVSLTETISQELAPFRVHASVVCPTFFRSRLAERTRTAEPSMQRLTEKLVGSASWTAEEVAAVCLRGLERGDTYIFPQRDARYLWYVKRMLGPHFPGLMGWLRDRAVRRHKQRRAKREGRTEPV